MEIKDKDINKLSQLDRIEFRQKNNKTHQLSNVGFIVSMIFICFSLSMRYLGNGLSYLFFLVLGLIIFFIFHSFGMNNRRKLESEYFKINLKDKKK